MKDLIKNKRWVTAALMVMCIIILIYSLLGCILNLFTDWDNQIPFFNIWYNLSEQNWFIILFSFVIYASSFFIDLDRVLIELDNDFFDFKHRISKGRIPFSMYSTLLLFIVGFNLVFIFSVPSDIIVSEAIKDRFRTVSYGFFGIFYVAIILRIVLKNIMQIDSLKEEIAELKNSLNKSQTDTKLSNNSEENQP
jgi:hypothetical protein